MIPRGGGERVKERRAPRLVTFSQPPRQNHGPDTCGWEDVSHLELATLSWVHWFNEERLHGYCGDIPPAEFEAAFYAGNDPVLPGLGNQ